MIENGVKYGAPKNMEWYGAFGLVLTLSLAIHRDVELVANYVIEMTRSLSVCNLEDWRAGGERREDFSNKWERHYRTSVSLR